MHRHCPWVPNQAHSVDSSIAHWSKKCGGNNLRQSPVEANNSFYFFHVQRKFWSHYFQTHYNVLLLLPCIYMTYAKHWHLVQAVVFWKRLFYLSIHKRLPLKESNALSIVTTFSKLCSKELHTISYCTRDFHVKKRTLISIRLHCTYFESCKSIHFFHV